MTYSPLLSITVSSWYGICRSLNYNTGGSGSISVAGEAATLSSPKMPVGLVQSANGPMINRLSRLVVLVILLQGGPTLRPEFDPIRPGLAEYVAPKLVSSQFPPFDFSSHSSN